VFFERKPIMPPRRSGLQHIRHTSVVQIFDAVVLGGGPAGLVTGILLSRRGRSVVVIERTGYDRPRAGETLGADLRPLLHEIGVADDLETLRLVPFREVQSAWGGPELVSRPSIFNPYGDGWHVDRKQFDQLLARCAGRDDVSVRAESGLSRITRAGDLWHVQPESGSVVAGRFLVEASGRGAPATTACIRSRQWLRLDRMVALLARMTGPTSIEPTLLLEAVDEGWWYSVPQPDGSLLFALMTDSDLLPARGTAAFAAHFSERLRHTIHTAGRARGAALAGEPWIARADSGLLLPHSGRGWLAVGDAAMACDPLAGDGVSRALRSAFSAVPEIERQLHEPGGTETESSTLLERFTSYLDRRGRYYEVEGRWRNSPFWKRRQPIAWQSAPLLLDPQSVLRLEAFPSQSALNSVEALIPPAVLLVFLKRLRKQSEPAHHSLSFLRSRAPLGDRRLLVGIQYLLTSGCISTGA
jgi:2-polyprenyl-6-methoxyphenol hydroxylase-like FAD-dependent oxidoreductase